jgi:purine nucleoside permease
MALCLDPELDLTRTYWIVTGISGIDPAHGSLGSAVWAANVVDADALREVDDREVPAGWPYGLFAIGTLAPNQAPQPSADAGGWGGATLTYTMNYALNPALAQWAHDFSRARVMLADSAGLQHERAKYTDYAPARQPPQVRMGAAFSTARYWHGAKRTQWARDWVRLWTGGKDVLATAAMEPAAYVGTLQRMAARGLVDFNRVMMIRGASNYTMPPPAQDILSTMGDESMGTAAAFESLHATGSVVIHELLANWAKYEHARPDEK